MRLYDIISRFYHKEECEIIVINDNCDCVDYFSATDKELLEKYKDNEIGMMEIGDDGDMPYLKIEVLFDWRT